MKWIAFLMALIMCTISGAMSQGDQYSNQYANNTTGAPAPVSPTSPEALGIETPSVTAVAPSEQAAVDGEQSQQLTKANQQMAYSASAGLGATSTSPSYTQMVVPSDGGITSANRLYLFYAPLTVAGCNLYDSLPLWLQISGTGDTWFYEWYPSGMLETSYAGYTYSPDWYRRYFIADTSGWHILQYYCSGWSNYAYIYVYASGGGASPAPSPDNPVNPYETDCEKDPWCSWVNGKCICESLVPSTNTERQNCEKKPYCNWVNGQCLCTGRMPSSTYGAGSNDGAGVNEGAVSVS